MPCEIEYSPISQQARYNPPATLPALFLKKRLLSKVRFVYLSTFTAPTSFEATLSSKVLLKKSALFVESFKWIEPTFYTRFLLNLELVNSTSLHLLHIMPATFKTSFSEKSEFTTSKDVSNAVITVFRFL